MLMKIAKQNGSGALFFLAVLLAAFSSVAHAGIGIAEQNSVDTSCVITNEMWGDWQTIHFSCEEDGLLKTVIVSRESQQIYAANKEHFIAGFKALYPFAPRTSLLIIELENVEEQTSAMKVSLYEYHLQYSLAANVPYSDGRSTNMTAAMKQALKKMCSTGTADKHTKECRRYL